MEHNHQMDPDDHVYPQPHRDDTQRGITLFYFYVAQAPDVPNFFIHQQRKKEYGQQPTWQTTKFRNEKDKEDVRDWMQGAIEDLPDHLKWFEDKVKKWDTDKHAWDLQDRTDRYFQWRVFYAETLIKTINESRT